MKKSRLKEVIKEVLRRKLNEIGDVVDMAGKPHKEQYGLVVSKDEDPIVQIVGYGKMKYSNLKTSIAKGLDTVKKEVAAGNFTNALHYTDKNSILILFLKAAQEIEDQLQPDGVSEIALAAPANPADAAADALSASAQRNPADQKKTMDLEKQKNDLQSKLEITKAKMSKTLTPYQRTIKQAEEKLGRVNVELQRLQAKAGK